MWNEGNPSNSTAGMGSNMQGMAGGNALDMQYAQNAAALKSPSVMEQLNIQEKTIMQTHAMLDQLADRLVPILGPTPPNVQADQHSSPTPNQLSQRIPMHTRGIEALGQRISELIARIEL